MTMNSNNKKAVWLLVYTSFYTAVVHAGQDSRFYASEYGMHNNPTVNQQNAELYFAEAWDVLDNLGQFEALYVTHHNCAWSQYDGGCDVNDEAGGGEDAQEYWYRAVAPCFRANAAFSLYGVLKNTNDDAGESTTEHGCHKQTYINSFMTVQGVESFTQAMVAAGVSFEQQNNYNNEGQQENNQQQNNEEGDREGEDREGGERRRLEGEEDGNAEQEQDNGDAQDEAEGNQDITSECVVIQDASAEGGEDGDILLNEYYTSSSLSCSSSGHYVTSYFQGAYCSGSLKTGDAEEPTAALQALNTGMEQVQCVQIYSASNNNNYYYNYQQEGEEQENNGDDQSPLSVLYNSYACSTEEFPQSCPDPYGKLKRYEHALNRSTGTSHNARRERIRFIVSVSFLSVGLFILIVPLCLARRRKIKKRQQTGPSAGEDSPFAKATIRKRTLFSRLVHAMSKTKSPRASVSPRT